MNSRTAFAAGSIASLVLAAGLGAGAAGSQGGKLTAARAVERARLTVLNLSKLPYQPLTSIQGTSVAWADPAARTAAFSALETPKGYRVVSGFKVAGFIPTSMIPNAKAKATFEVSEVVGLGIAAQIGVCAPSCSNSQYRRGLVFTSSTKPFTLTTETFTLEPNREYAIVAEIHADESQVSGMMTGAVVRITDVKWEF